MNEMRKLMESLDRILEESTEDLGPRIEACLSEVYRVLNEADMRLPEVSLSDFFSKPAKLSRLAQAASEGELTPELLREVERALHWAHKDLQGLASDERNPLAHLDTEVHDRDTEIRMIAEDALYDVEELRGEVRSLVRSGQSGLRIDIEQSPRGTR